MTLTRRQILKGLGLATVVASAGMPKLAFGAAATNRRMVVVFLRGGMDGLAAVPAYGDPNFVSARQGIALPRPGEEGGDLYQGRDLMPTLDMRSVIKGVLIEHLGVDETHIERKVFPGSRSTQPLSGLINT